MSSIRRFFEQRGVLEVETPVLSHCTSTEPHLDSFELASAVGGPEQYLLPSPEFEMKRLVAAGSGPVFQIGRAFRREECGRLHNPEFSMLEWYRPDFTLVALQQELNDLLDYLGFSQSPTVVSYRQAFIRFAGLDPWHATADQWMSTAQRLAAMAEQHIDAEVAADIIMSHQVEPELAAMGSVYLVDFPANQAAMARIGRDESGHPVAKRFELYINGIEIANAYDELNCPQQQKSRFNADNSLRQRLGKAEIPIDRRLLAALTELPPCAGVAVGLDRLLMVQQGLSSVQEVIAFPAGTV